MFTARHAILAATALAAGSLAAPASAQTVINLNGIEDVSNYQARQGYRVAAAYWESVLTNNATINLDIAFEALDPDVLAQAGSYRGDVLLSDVYGALGASRNSALDAVAYTSLTTQVLAGGGNTVNALVSSVEDLSVTINDTNQSYNNGVLYENTAVMKALGLTTYTGPDAEITFSSEILFDFNPSDGIDAGASDFVGVAIHEIGHALGFTSGVDYYDIYGCGPVSVGPGCGLATDADFDGNSWMRTLDLFRYSSAGQLDWTVGTPSYFSIDNGLTEFNIHSNFSSGAYNGDGWQASHWQAPMNSSGQFTCNKTNRIGIMNPYSCGGQGDDVKANDLAALDAMGWNLNIDVLANPNYSVSSGDIYSQLIGTVPEPSTWAMLILGFGVIGGSLRRRTKAQLRFA